MPSPLLALFSTPHTRPNKERPVLAEVDRVVSEEYAGDITPLWQFATFTTASQMNKAIPVLLEIKNDIKEMKGDLKGLREDIQPGFALQIRQVQSDVRAIKERLGMP